MAARNWRDVRAELIESGQVTEEGIASAREESLRVQRAYRLAEIRKERDLTQAEVAQLMGVSQPRVSAIESGDLSRAEFGTLEAYVEALGGTVRIVADFGDQSVNVA